MGASAAVTLPLASSSASVHAVVAEPQNTAPFAQESALLSPESPSPIVQTSTILPVHELNSRTTAALVNIFCKTKSGSGRIISGSGVLIDPRGVILTNAHVAQYLLLAAKEGANLTCVVRTGSPAFGSWTADILYMPASWMEKHAKDIRNTSPLSTGENDYALLLITGSTTGVHIPSFPYLPVDTNAPVANMAVLAAGYPAEFLNGDTTENLLRASSLITTVRERLTFNESTVDVISLGGVLLAQSGSSGGAVVNESGELTGLISTTSQGDTTTSRNVRAITLHYIDRALSKESGTALHDLLAGDIHQKTRSFMQTTAPLFTATLTEYFNK